MLRNLEDETDVVVLNLERVQNRGKLIFKLHVNDGADDLLDLADGERSGGSSEGARALRRGGALGGGETGSLSSDRSQSLTPAGHGRGHAPERLPVVRTETRATNTHTRSRTTTHPAQNTQGATEHVQQNKMTAENR